MAFEPVEGQQRNAIRRKRGVFVVQRRCDAFASCCDCNTGCAYSVNDLLPSSDDDAVYDDNMVPMPSAKKIQTCRRVSLPVRTYTP